MPFRMPNGVLLFILNRILCVILKLSFLYDPMNKFFKENKQQQQIDMKKKI